jgi:hypothetical protein
MKKVATRPALIVATTTAMKKFHWPRWMRDRPTVSSVKNTSAPKIFQ